MVPKWSAFFPVRGSNEISVICQVSQAQFIFKQWVHLIMYAKNINVQFRLIYQRVGILRAVFDEFGWNVWINKLFDSKFV